MRLIVSSIVSSTGHCIEHLVSITGSISETRREAGISVGVYAVDDEIGSDHLPALALAAWPTSADSRRRRHLPENMPALGMAAPSCRLLPHAMCHLARRAATQEWFFLKIFSQVVFFAISLV
jgi:hypothetical protein